MAISINWATKVITIPQADLTFISGSLYELNVNTFRLTLKDREDDEAGMPFLRTHNHNTEVTVGGVTLARVVEIINGYTITFQDVGSPYTVRCVGANHNISDVKNVNQVSLIVGNAAGLVVSGSGVTEQDKVDIVNATWDELTSEARVTGTYGQKLKDFALTAAGRIDVGLWQGSAPDALLTGKVPANTQVIGVDALDAVALKTDAVSEIADGVHDEVVEGSNTLRQLLRLISSALFGKLSGAGTTTIAIRDLDDTKNRIMATVDADGNRTSVVRDGS